MGKAHPTRLHLKRTSGISVEEQDLVSSIKGMLSPETWEAIGDVKIKRKRKAVKQTSNLQEPEAPEVEEKIETPPDEPSGK
ncbi:MAG TPA: hypothetical protein VFF54_07790 [Thermodesulfobacteriota bacterium]|nr:hypothetical protein [Thermodesulfobacteriota bacterium]